MKRLALAAALAALALPVLAQDNGIVATDARWEKAMRAGDAAAAAACYSDDAKLWFPGDAEASGKAAIQKLYAGFFDAYKVVDVALTEPGTLTSAELSAGWGHYTMKLQPKKGGETIVLKGRYTAAAKKVGGQWVYVADHASADPAPAPATPSTPK